MRQDGVLRLIRQYGSPAADEAGWNPAADEAGWNPAVDQAGWNQAADEARWNPAVDQAFRHGIDSTELMMIF